MRLAAHFSACSGDLSARADSHRGEGDEVCGLWLQAPPGELGSSRTCEDRKQPSFGAGHCAHRTQRLCRGTSTSGVYVLWSQGGLP